MFAVAPLLGDTRAASGCARPVTTPYNDLKCLHTTPYNASGSKLEVMETNCHRHKPVIDTNLKSIPVTSGDCKVDSGPVVTWKQPLVDWSNYLWFDG